MELIDDMRHVDSRFGLFRDSVSVGEDGCMVSAKHTIGSEIILNEPDGAPS
jgi:hypothetical protein